MDNKETAKLLNLLHIFTANLILQVFGAGGAIWGFSEVVGLRTPETVWFWRPVAQLVGAIFFARWILELNAYIDEHDIRFLSWRSSKHEVVADQEECATTEESKLLMTER